MVANHAHKKLARELVANSEHPLSYTKAMAHALRIAHGAKINDLRSISALELTAEIKSVIARAAKSLVTGSDLVIFGLTGTGKSTAAYSVLEESQLRNLILTSHYLEAAYLRSYLNVPAMVQPQHLFVGMTPKLGVEVVVVDELRNSFADQGAQLSAADRRVIVVHGNSLEDARWRLNRMLPALELRSPVFLEAIYDRRLPGRRLKIHKGISHPAIGSVLEPNSEAILKRVTLTVSRNGSDQVIGSANDLEEILVLLRFSQLTVGKRYREMADDADGQASVDALRDPLNVIVEEAENESDDQSYGWGEAHSILDHISNFGASADVHLTTIRS